MTPLVPLVMFGWIPAVLLLFSQLPARRAVIAAFILAWLFLPVARYEFAGLPEYTKMSATCVGVLLGAMLFDAERLASFRFHPVDIPLLLWCLSPCISSLTNGLGLYDGVSAMVNQITTWALPYFVGRVYLGDLEAAKELCLGMFVGGLVYIPFCLWEGRMSPQLHRILYGFYAHPDFAQSIRFGGYRPMVFMEHGLMVGMWMASAGLVGVWLWVGGAVFRVSNVSMKLLAPLQVVMAILVKSMGAVGLMVIGLGALFFSTRFKTRSVLMVLICVAPLYMGLRATGIWSGESLTEAIAKINTDRAESLQFRLDNEKILIEKAVQRPIFGWGGWGRSRVYNELGEDISTTDGLWIIALGKYGAFGVSAITLIILAPPFVFVRRVAVERWSSPQGAPVAALCMLLALYMIDNLLNAMVNPIFIFTAGGMSGLVASGALEKLASGEPDFDKSAPPALLESTGWRTRFI